MRSQMMGLRLWGIAEDPFCPSAKYSSASNTSVRWRCRISVANFSSEPPMSASTVMNSACRSRWMIWVDTGAGLSPSFSQTYSSTFGLRCS